MIAKSFHSWFQSERTMCTANSLGISTLFRVQKNAKTNSKSVLCQCGKLQNYLFQKFLSLLLIPFFCFLILRFKKGMLKFTTASVQTLEMLNCKSLSTVNLTTKNYVFCLKILLTLSKSQNFCVHKCIKVKIIGCDVIALLMCWKSCNAAPNCKFH